MGSKEQKIEIIINKVKNLDEYERDLFDYILFCVESMGEKGE